MPEVVDRSIQILDDVEIVKVEEVGKTVQIYFLRGAGVEIYRLLDHLTLKGEPIGYVVGE